MDDAPLGVRFPTCLVHATFFLLDKNDQTLGPVLELGTATAPVEHDFAADDAGEYFTATAADKAQAVRADGSIRLRAVVRLFLD